jgi:hypothetical protein
MESANANAGEPTIRSESKGGSGVEGGMIRRTICDTVAVDDWGRRFG